MTGQQLELGAGEHLVDVVEVLDGIAVVGEAAPEISAAATADESALVQRNPFEEAERIAARAASVGDAPAVHGDLPDVRTLATSAAGASAGRWGSRR